MTLHVTEETETGFSFDCEATALAVLNAVLDGEGCPYEAAVDILITDDEAIHRINLEQRGIDRATDVLSFPMTQFPEAGKFDFLEEEGLDSFDPDSGELMLGDIVISADHVHAQAREYGHSERREFAFLVAHSLFHLIGYDHMAEEEAAIMEQKQRDILSLLHITRE